MSGGRVLIVDDDELFAGALELVLAEEGYDVVGTVSRRQPAPSVPQERVDLVLTSAALLDQAAVLGQRSATSQPRVLVLDRVCQHSQLVKALDAGAQGYLGKDCSLAELLTAIATVLDGAAHVPPPMLAGLLHELVQRRRSAPRPGAPVLSRREQEVLHLLVQGLGHVGIAKVLVISPQTARTHIQKVIAKLGVHSRGEAVAVALRHGLVAS